MTDNVENEPCFMCKVEGECTLIASSNVYLCTPCIEDLENIRVYG